MKAYIDREHGKIVGAYWAPESAGFGFASKAAAFLGVDGKAKTMHWQTRQWKGQSESYISHTSPGIDDSIRKELESAIMQELAVLAACENRQDGPRDAYGNLNADGDE